MDRFNYNDYKNTTRKVESGGNDTAKNPDSTASGRYQFTKGTWEGLGYKWKDRFNPELQEQAMEKFTNSNVSYFKNNFKVEPSFADVYGMHFLGSAGYKNVYSAEDNTPIQNVVTKAAYNSNKSVFNKYRTVGEFKKWLSNKTGQPTTKSEVTPTQIVKEPTKNYLPDLVTMQGQSSNETVDLSFAEKAEEAKTQIQQYQEVEDKINQMPTAQAPVQQQVVDQPQSPTYEYLFNQDLFQIQSPQIMQDGGTYGVRNDGTQKDIGYLGELNTSQGDIMTENSIGVEIDGQEVEIPTVVPTLTQEEIDWLIKGNNVLDRSNTAETIINKAIEHAQKRLKEGNSPFYTKTYAQEIQQQ